MDLYSYIDDCAENAVQRVFDEWPTYRYELDELIQEMIDDECEIIYYAEAYDIVNEARHNWNDYLDDAEMGMGGMNFDSYDDHTMFLAGMFLRGAVTEFFTKRDAGRLLMGN
jgi:hypothetical protein